MKTLTGCTIGQPIIVGVKSNTTATGGWKVSYNIKSGSNIGYTNKDDSMFKMGTLDGSSGFVLIPTATSITFDLWDVDTNEYVYVYRAG